MGVLMEGKKKAGQVIDQELGQKKTDQDDRF